VAGHDFVELREVSSGRLVRQFLNPPPDPQKLAKWPRQTLAVSPDGKLLAAPDGLAIRVWDVLSGKEVGMLTGHTAAILSLAFAPDG
jgi:WD40 repeat protein